MKKISIIFLVCMMLVGCTDTSTLESENLELYSEIESLKAENELLQQQLTETEITTVSSSKITTKKTNPVATEKTMSEEDVKSIIGVSGANIAKINSADGVDIVFYWRNNSDKQIKYITFNISIYNAVNDIITDEISGNTTFKCKLTGPVDPIKEKIEKAKIEFLDSMDLYYNNETISLRDGFGLCYREIDMNPNTGELTQTYISIPESDYDKLTLKTKFETVLYNSTAKKVKINSIDIEYMDNSKVSLNSKEVSLAFIE